MNPWIGWLLAAAVVVVSYVQYGLKGLALSVTLIVFWLVLQLNRSIRAMKNASQAPVGSVPSAVMFNAKLKAGMSLLQVISMTKSLGRRVSQTPEQWAWTDDGASTVTVTLQGGRVTGWQLERPAAEEPPAP